MGASPEVSTATAESGFLKDNKNENRNIDRSSLTGSHLRCVWAQCLFEFPEYGPMPTGLAGQFMGALVLSHYYWAVAALQILGGALLLANRFVPLALVLLGPVIVNIPLYHAFLNPAGMVPAMVVTILWFIVFYHRRQYFSGIFVQRT